MIGSVRGNTYENVANVSLLDVTAVFRGEGPMTWEPRDQWGGDSNRAIVSFTHNHATGTVNGVVLARLFLNMGPEGPSNQIDASIAENDGDDLGVLVALPHGGEILVVPGDHDSGRPRPGDANGDSQTRTGLMRLETDAPWNVTAP